MRLQKLVRVYTCQNATLLEISCHGSYHSYVKWMPAQSLVIRICTIGIWARLIDNGVTNKCPIEHFMFVTTLPVSIVLRFCVRSFFNAVLSVLSCLQSSRWGKASRLIYYYCVIAVNWLFVFCVSSCRVLVNRSCLDHFRGIPWNQTSDVHRAGSTLITWRWCYITWCWHHINYAYTIASVIAAKKTVINEVNVLLLFFFSIKYRFRYSDILLKNTLNFNYSADETFQVISKTDFNMLQNLFSLRQSQLTKWSCFVHSTTRNAPNVDLHTRIVPGFPDWLAGLRPVILAFSGHTYLLLCTCTCKWFQVFTFKLVLTIVSIADYVWMSPFTTDTACITWLFAYCKGGNFNIHIWAWFGYFIY